MERMSIVVLTPTKNEAWILPRFLDVCSQFADLILIADQFSSDASRDIIGRYPKAMLIENPNSDYDENFRQQLLIKKAREIIPGRKLLLALDADEIMTADSLNSNFWYAIESIEPGTILSFEKPEVMLYNNTCLRYNDFFLLGYIDDGAPHTGKKIHSTRIPKNDKSRIIRVDDVKFMHYAHSRPVEYRARQRLYSIVEKNKGTDPFYRRLLKYSNKLVEYLPKTDLKPIPFDWIDNWEFKGIDMRTIESSLFNTYNLQVIDHFLINGSSTYYLDDIWDIDWEDFYFKHYGEKPPKAIKNIPWRHRLLLNCIIKILRLKNKL